MAEYIITLDGGTTNTRAFLWDSQGHVLHKTGAHVGVRDTATDGHNGRLKQAIKGCLDQLIAAQGIDYDDVCRIVASGMLSSNVGITEVPHLCAPASVQDFMNGAAKTLLPDICPLPLYIVPGLKNNADPQLDTYETMDIMRGEETESIPLIRKYGGKDPLILVLPGSHNKFIAVDAQGEITGCLTTISGELLSAITEHTILADASGKRFVAPAEYDKEMVLMGSRNAQKTGLGRACFSGRILNQFLIGDKTKIANYLLGIVYGEDLKAILNSSVFGAVSEQRIIIAGKEPLSLAMADILKDSGYFSNVEVYQGGAIPLAAEGAYLIAKRMEDNG